MQNGATEGMMVGLFGGALIASIPFAGIGIVLGGAAGLTHGVVKTAVKGAANGLHLRSRKNQDRTEAMDNAGNNPATLKVAKKAWNGHEIFIIKHQKQI